MRKAFRRTGIEGGTYVTLNEVLWQHKTNLTTRGLTAHRKGDVAPAPRFRNDPPCKKIENPFLKGMQPRKLGAALLRYAEKPGMYQGWKVTVSLLSVGMIKEISKPTHHFYAGASGDYFSGGIYAITPKGQAYVDQLRKPVLTQPRDE